MVDISKIREDTEINFIIVYLICKDKRHLLAYSLRFYECRVNIYSWHMLLSKCLSLITDLYIQTPLPPPPFFFKEGSCYVVCLGLLLVYCPAA